MAYLGSTPTSQNFISGTDYFNGTGSQTAFTLTRSVNSVNDVEVVVNNVIQQPNGYTVSGTTLTLSAAPSSGTSNVYVRYLATNQQSFTVGNNTVGYNQLTADMQSKFAMKNRIINGAMVIDQRNAGASVSADNSGLYTLDRWRAWEDSDGAATVQQVSDAPVGFVNSLKWTTTTADSSLAAAQYCAIGQYIEGYNIADLGWGTANAKTITVSFWVKSSLTGTFGAALNNGASTYRAYPFTYTINTANTWEQKSVTIAGDTTGTWATTNSTGIRLYFGLGVGSTYSGTAGAWANGSLFFSVTGATSVIGTLNATFQITGVQLEVGSSATGFEYRQYQQELALCQRYFEMSYGIGTVPATATFLDMYMSTSNAGSFTTGFIETLLPYKVSKRAAAILTFYDSAGTSGKCTRQVVGVSATTGQNIAIDQFGLNGATIYSSGTSSATGFFYHFTASAEL